MAFKWDQSLSIGVEKIDQQHRDLFARINSLLKATSLPGKREEATKMLAFLDQYVATHFATEERYMAAFTYPGQSAHIQQHETFRRSLLPIKERFEAKSASDMTSILVQQRVADWWLDHIPTYDRALGEFLRLKI